MEEDDDDDDESDDDNNDSESDDDDDDDDDDHVVCATEAEGDNAVRNAVSLGQKLPLLEQQEYNVTLLGFPDDTCT